MGLVSPVRCHWRKLIFPFQVFVSWWWLLRDKRSCPVLPSVLGTPLFLICKDPVHANMVSVSSYINQSCCVGRHCFFDFLQAMLMAQWVECFLHKHEKLHFNAQISCKILAWKYMSSLSILIAKYKVDRGEFPTKLVDLVAGYIQKWTVNRSYLKKCEGWGMTSEIVFTHLPPHIQTYINIMDTYVHHTQTCTNMTNFDKNMVS